jgi:hypothetical protein
VTKENADGSKACIDAIDSSTEIAKLTAEVIQINTSVIDKSMGSGTAVEKLDEPRHAWLAASGECWAKR